jgi:hypothetical protein
MNGKPTNHGGRRDGAGPPRKMVNPARVTVTIEKSQLEAFKNKHGNRWQDVLRGLVSSHLNQ